MSKSSGIGAGTSLAIGTVATVVVLGGGIFLARGGSLGPGAKATVEDYLAMLGLYDMPAPVSAPVAAPVAPTPNQPAQKSSTAPEVEQSDESNVPRLEEDELAAAEAETEDKAADMGFVLVPPVLELARFERDGSGLVAGAGQAGVRIEVLLDGVVIESLTVEEDGEFAAFVALEPSDQARVLSLLARFEDQELASEDSFILAPIASTTVADLAVQPGSSPVETEANGGSNPGAGAEPSADNGTALAAIAVSPEGDGASSNASVVDTARTQTNDAAAAPTSVGETDVVAETGSTAGSSTVAATATTIVEDATADPFVNDATDGSVVQTTDAATAPDASETGPSVITTGAAPITSLQGGAAEMTADVAQNQETATVTAEASAAQTIASPKPSLGTETPSEPVGTSAPTSSPDVASGERTAAQSASPEVVGTVALDPQNLSDEAGLEADSKSAPQPDVAIAVLRAGKDGVALVQPAAPVAPELLGKVALDTISYSDSGDVQLAGRAMPDALVRVYLDNSPVSDITVEPTGQWSGQLTSIAPGIYTLRLDEIDPIEGKVLSRLETPFKREAPEALQAVVTAEASPGTSPPAVQAVTVQKGDTLWAISQARYGSGVLYVRVFEANKGDIRDPDLIYPGQIFTLPE